MAARVGCCVTGWANASVTWAWGAWPEVGLAEARQQTADARKRLRSGADPIETRKAERAAAARARHEASERTFETVAESYIARHEPGWKNDKHRRSGSRR